MSERECPGHGPGGEAGTTFFGDPGRCPDCLRARVADLERELADADERAAANGARAAELAALLKPFADAYAEALACSPSLEADHPDGGAFLFRKPRMAAWRAAHRAVYPPKEPTT
jgi:hypothetical protein